MISIANPAQGVRVIEYLLGDAARWRQFGDIGRKRVLQSYDQSMMYAAYRNLYEGAIKWRE